MTRSWWPDSTPVAAIPTACWPEPQKRLIVSPGVAYGHPALSTASRAMSAPWSPMPLALPAMTSSISVDATPVRCDDRVEALRQQLLGVDVVQRAVLLALAPRGAHAVDDPGLALAHGS